MFQLHPAQRDALFESCCPTSGTHASSPAALALRIRWAGLSWELPVHRGAPAVSVLLTKEVTSAWH